MTMHLAQGLTTTRTSVKKRKKPTKAQLEKYIKDMKAHNKHMRQIHAHDQQLTLDEYIDYRHGIYKPKRKEEFKPYVPPEPIRRETKHIPSLGTGVGVATKKESPKYTGDLICGIATMHKSNAVPVMKGTKQAEDIAKMRR